MKMGLISKIGTDNTTKKKGLSFIASNELLGYMLEPKLKKGRNDILLSGLKSENGRLTVDKDKLAQSKGFIDAWDEANYKEKYPALYEGLGGIKYIKPGTNADVSGSPIKASATYDSNYAKNLSRAAVGKLFDRAKNTDQNEINNIIKKLNSNEWQDADTMKKYSDRINTYVNDTLALDELGYFNHLSEAEKNSYIDSLKSLKEVVNSKKDSFADYKDADSYNNIVWKNKYGAMSWDELEEAERQIKDNLLEKNGTNKSSLQELQYVKSLRNDFENPDAYDEYVKVVNMSFNELTKEYLNAQRDLQIYNDIQQSREVAYVEEYRELAPILRKSGYKTNEEIWRKIKDDSDGYLKQLKNAEDALKIDEKYGGIDALKSRYALLEELYYRGYTNERTSTLVLEAMNDPLFSDFVTKGKKKTIKNKYMTDTEYDVACYYAVKGGEDNKEYSQELQDELQRREIKDRQQKFASFAEIMPITASVASVPLNIIAAGEQVIDAAKYITTGNVDYNTNALGASTIRGTISEKIDNPIRNFTYNTTMSGVDSLASMGLSKVITGSDKLGSVILGLSAAGNATNDAINRGLSDGYAFASGVAAGVFETLFESWSIGKFSEGVDSLDLEDLKNISNFVGKNIWNNALEEDLTEVANIAYDILVNGKYSQYETSIKNYMILGFSEDRAKRKVAFELAGQVGEAAASGALMGFGFSGAGAAKTSIVNKNIRRAIASATFGQSQESVIALVENGLAMSEGSEAYKLAVKSEAKLKSGKSLSGTALYNLATAIESEIETKSEVRLSELGVDKNTAKELSPIVAKAVFGEQLTSQEYEIIKNNNIAAQVVKELSADRANTIWKNAIKNNSVNFSSSSNKNTILHSESNDNIINTVVDNYVDEKANAKDIEKISQVDVLSNVSGESHRTDNESHGNKALNELELTAILNYKSSASYIINDVLRNSENLSDVESEFVRNMDDALIKMPTYQGTVYRNIAFDWFGGQEAYDAFLSEHKVHDFVTYLAYTSASIKEDGYLVDGRFAVSMVIENGNAKNVDGYGNNFECEVIFPRNSVFVVNNVKYNDKGQPVIYMTEVIENDEGEHGQFYSKERSEAVQSLQKPIPRKRKSELQDISDENTTRCLDRKNYLQSVSGTKRGLKEFDHEEIEKLKEGFEDRVESRLLELGVDKNTAKELSPVVAKAVFGEQLTSQEYEIIKNNNIAAQVVKELSADRANTIWKDAIKNSRINNSTDNNSVAEQGEVLQSDEYDTVDSDNNFNYNDNSIKEGENYNGEDTKLLERGTVSATDRGDNILRESGTNSETLRSFLEISQGYNAAHGRTIRAGESSWICRKPYTTGENSEGYEQGVSGKIRGIELSGKDTIGGTVSAEILERFKNTICKDGKGNLISLYHWTNKIFESLKKGEFGFHFGTLRAAYDRYLQLKEENSDVTNGVYKEVILNITNPIEMSDGNLQWTPDWVAFQLLQKGIIDEQQYNDLSKLLGFDENTYDNPAAKAVREILAQNGYDGIIYENLSEDSGSYSLIALYPEQIITIAENGVLKENSGISRAVSEEGVASFDLEAKQSNEIDVDEFIKGLNGEENYSVVDNINHSNYNDNGIKEGESYADDYQETVGSFRGESQEYDARGTKENARIRKEDKIAFERRIKETYGNTKRCILKSNIAIAYKDAVDININSAAGIAYNILKSKGYGVVYCDGTFWLNNGKESIEVAEAVTMSDGTIYISSEATLRGKGIALHEVVHVLQYTGAKEYLTYKDVICEEIDHTSNEYAELAKEINDNHYGGKYDIDGISSLKYIIKELAAYINQYVNIDIEYARKRFGGAFKNFENVVRAVYDLNDKLGFGDIIGEATSQKGVASFYTKGDKQYFDDGSGDEYFGDSADVGKDNAVAPQVEARRVPELVDVINRFLNGEKIDIDEINEIPIIKKLKRISETHSETHVINTAERNLLRRKIAEKLLQNGSAVIDSTGKVIYNGNVKQEYRADIVIGLPGSGKSSTLAEPLSQYYSSRVVDSDMVKKMLPEYNGGIGAGIVHKESVDINNIILQKAMEKGDNIVYQMIGGGKVNSLINRIKMFKEGGYSVYLHLNELPNYKAIARSLNRYIEEGRFISPKVIAQYGDTPTRNFYTIINAEENLNGIQEGGKYGNNNSTNVFGGIWGKDEGTRVSETELGGTTGIDGYRDSATNRRRSVFRGVSGTDEESRVLRSTILGTKEESDISGERGNLRGQPDGRRILRLIDGYSHYSNDVERGEIPKLVNISENVREFAELRDEKVNRLSRVDTQKEATSKMEVAFFSSNETQTNGIDADEFIKGLYGEDNEKTYKQNGKVDATEGVGSVQSEYNKVASPGVVEDKVNNIGKKEYDKFFLKKPIKVSQKDWSKVNTARLQKYSHYSEEDIPDVDFFRIAEYNKINTAYKYVVRNYDKYNFEIVFKTKIKPEASQVRLEEKHYDETAYTKDDASWVRLGSDRNGSFGIEYGQTIRNDDSVVGVGEESDKRRSVNKDDSDSGRRIDNDGITKATLENEVAFSVDLKDRIKSASDTSAVSEAVDSENAKDLQLSEPALKDIARAPTAEESIAAAISNERLDTKQRRILDFVEQHFPKITLKFSSNMTKGGLCDPESKTLLLNTNQTVAGMYIEVLKHEFMHRLESKRLYQEFKQFLFNKDVTFGVWAKVQCKVHGIELTQNATASEAISKLTGYYYDSVKSDMAIAKKYRDAFTMDGAQREMVADFFGEVMFNGKKYRTQIAQALADETFITIFDENERAEFQASSMAALAEIAEYKPKIYQQIVDWVKHIILKLRGTHIRADAILADELERNIKMLEDYVKQVYYSRDIKTSTSINFSSNINEYPYSMQTVINDYLNSVDLEFIDFINDARSETNKKRLEYMHYEFNNNINEKVLIKANNILGFDISNYKIIINGESIHHIDKRHGKNGKHDQSMRNDLDLSRAQYIFTNADHVSQAINSSGQKAIDTQYRDKNNEPSKILLFAKKINGTYCIALASPCSNKETLHVKSMYFSKKIEDIQEFDTNSPEPTPKANLEISSKNIIVNEFLDVNKKQEKFTGINNSRDTKKAAENGGGVRYSLGMTTDGRIVAVVDNDILNEIDTTTWDKNKKEVVKEIASNALKQFRNGIVVDGITRKVNRTSRREYTRSDYTEKLYNKMPNIFADKMRAADIADDIVVATTNWSRDGGLIHSREDNFIDFEHGTTLIMLGNTKYIAKVVVGITNSGEAVFYDVVDMTPTTFDIKKVEPPTTATTQNAIGDIQENSTIPSVAQTEEYVKQVYNSRDTKKAAENGGGVEFKTSLQNNYDYSKSFAQQIDDYKSGKIPNRDTLLVGGTPDVYQLIGLNALPMTINTTHIDYALNGTKDADHHLGETILKQLPKSIKEPIAIFVSQTKGNSSVVALLNFEVNGKQTVVPIVIDEFGVQNSLVIDSNAITSVYGKGSAINQLYQAAQNEANGKFSLLYINKKEADSLLHRAGHQLSGSLIPRDGFYHSIREKGSPVKSRFNDVTETQQFKRWFGDWQKHPNTASKVVDKNGKPLVMYHGSNSEFTIFDLQKSGGNYGDTSEGLMFFTNKKDAYPDSASDYAREATKKSGGNEKVYEVYLQIFKPLELDSKGYYTTTAYFDANYESIYNKYLSGDYDGIIIKNSDTASDDGILCAVDSPTQIKSAKDNVGTFDANNGNIKFAVTSQMQQLRYNSKLSNNSNDLNLKEPALKDIARAPTAEESIAAAISNEKLDTKQRRILDFVEQHFPEITLKFSSNMTKGDLWDPESKTLLLNTNQTVAGMYIEVLKHEFMHRLESKRLYQEFKQFLFNKDVTFGVWAKVQCKVHGIELTQNATASEALSKLTGYYYDSVKSDMAIAKKYRDAFTMDGAQREMVADFFGEVMFNGKKYRTQIAQALADETFITIFDENERAEFQASSMAALAEIAEYKPKIYQQIVDWVKRIILKLRGTHIRADAILADELERNIKMLEHYVKQVWRSNDVKSNVDEVKYAFKNSYWYPNMKKSEIDLVKRIAKREINTTDNYIDNENKWLYNKLGDKNYFALYSTAHTDDPTVLYACKGEKAEFEYSYLLKVLQKEANNNGNIHTGTRVVGEVSGNNKSKQSAKTFDNGNTVGRGSDAGDAGLYSKNTRRRASEALLNCLRNIEKAQGDVGRVLGRGIASKSDPQFAVTSQIQQLRYNPEALTKFVVDENNSSAVLNNSGIAAPSVVEDDGKQYLDDGSGDNITKSNVADDKVNNIGKKEYDKFFFKKPIKVSKKDWSNVNTARLQKYSHYSEEDIPDVDFFKIAEYNQINIAYRYYIRNYDKYKFEVISKIRIKEEKNNVETTNTNVNSNGVRYRADSSGGRFDEHGKAIQNDDKLVEWSEESDKGRIVNNGNSDSGRRIDNSDIKTATSKTEVAFSMPSDYSYEALINKPDIKIIEIDSFNGKISNDTRKDIVDKAVENAAAIGRKNENGNAVVYVKDIDTEIILSKSGLRYGIDRRFELLAPVLLKSGEILKNSIRINELNPRVDNISKSYVLIGVAKNTKNEPYIISFVVNKVTGEVSTVDVLYAINAETEPAGSLSPSVPAKVADYFTDSTISISKLLDYVNKYFPDILPESVLRHYGYESRPEGKIGESTLFSMPIGKRKKIIENNVIELSKDNELSKRIGDLRGAAKNKVIQQYILDILNGEEITLSDGKVAVVDKNDAKYIASNSGIKKTAEISQIKKIIEKALLVAEEESMKERKFEHFYYYEAAVKYDGEIFNIYLNVGRSSNDQSYHLYDITQKLRDTANRINGLERPKPNEGYALTNGISNNSITKSVSNVNKDNSTKTDNLGYEALNEKEQGFIERICNRLGTKVVFEDLREMVYKGEILSPDGYIDVNGVIHLNIYAQNPIGFIFKHELTHFAEKAKRYFEFVKQVKRSSLYEKWITEKMGESDVRIAEYKYKQAVARTHSDIYGATDPKAEAEMIADFAGEMLFTENGSGMVVLTSDLDTKQRNTVIQFVLDFISFLKKKLSGIDAMTFELSRMEDRFNELLSDAKNNDGVYDNEVKFSIKAIFGNSGKNYGIGVYLDSELLTGLTENERKQMLKEFVVSELAGQHFIGYDNENHVVDIGIAKKNVTIRNKQGKKRRVVDELYSKNNNILIKQESVVLAEELIATAQYDTSITSKYSHDWLDNYGKNDWEYWKVFIQEKNKAVWEATLNIANTTNGEKILYDIDPIKKVEDAVESAVTTTFEVAGPVGSGPTTTNDSILQNNVKSQDVNDNEVKFSKKVNENNDEFNELLSDAKNNDSIYDNEVKFSIKQSFYTQLDNWDKETIGFSFVVGTTSDALLSAGVPNKQIRWNASKIRTLLNKHIGMDIEIVRQIPNLLENPIVVIDSKQNHNSRIVIGELRDNNGKLVTVVILLTPTSKKGNQLDVIKISSAQGRGHIESLFKKDDGEFVKIWYIDKERIQSWLNVNRLQLPLHSFNLDSNSIVSNFGTKVNGNNDEFNELLSDATRMENDSVYGYDVDIDNKILYQYNDYHDSNYGEMLYNTPKTLQPTSDREWKTFCRSFANKTNGIQKGEHRLISIFTANNYYIIDANGYMCGKIMIKETINDNMEKEKFLDDYTSTKIFGDYDDRYGSGQRNGNDGNDTFAGGIPDTFNVELDAFIESHPEWFANKRETYADYKRRIEATSKGEVAFSMPSDYSYEALINKPDMIVTILDDNDIPNNRVDLVTAAKKNAAAIGKVNKDGSISVYVEDIGKEIVVGKKGLVHGLDRSFSENAKATLRAGEIIKNSIKINELTPAKQEADESYVLIGAAVDADGKLNIIRFIVNRFSNELLSMNVLYAINTKKESTAVLNAPLASTPDYRTTISISKLLDYVNKYFPDILPESVLRHYGYESRPEGKIGESTLFSMPIGKRKKIIENNVIELSKDNELSKRIGDLRGGMPFDYIEELLSNPDNYELEIVRRQPARSATGEKHPNTSSELPSRDIIFDDLDNVNNNYATKTDAFDDEVRFSFNNNQNESNAVITIIRENIEKISDYSIFDVQYDELPPNTTKSNYVFNIFKKQGGVAYNKHIGVVELTKSGAKSTVFHGFGKSKLAATAAIKTIIEKGDIIDFSNNYKGTSVDRYVIAAKGLIDDRPSYVGVVIKAYPNNKNSNAKFYLHEALIIEADSPIMTATQLNADTVSESTSNNIISKKPKKINDKNLSDTSQTNIFEGLEKLNAREMKEMENVCNKLGREVVFEDLREMVYKGEILSPDGYIDANGVIHLNTYAQNPIGFIFKHELTHFAEKAKRYFEFVKQVKRSSLYEKWITEKMGESDVRIAEYKYKQAVARTHSDIYGATDPKAEAEMIADFVGEMLFNKNGSGMAELLGELDTKQQNIVVRFVLEFINLIKRKIGDLGFVSVQLDVLQHDFIQLLIDASDQQSQQDFNDIYKQSDIKFCFAICDDNEVIEQAERLEAEGVDKYEIFNEIGVIKNIYGTWLMELGPRDFKLLFTNVEGANNTENKNIKRIGNTIEGKLSDFVEYKSLFKRYPQLKNIGVVIKEAKLEGNDMKYIPPAGKIFIDKKLYDDYIENQTPIIRILMLQEIQKMVNYFEGIHPGKDISTWQELEKQGKTPYYKPWHRKMTAEEAYKNTYYNYIAKMVGIRESSRELFRAKNYVKSRMNNTLAYKPYMGDEIIALDKNGDLILTENFEQVEEIQNTDLMAEEVSDTVVEEDEEFEIEEHALISETDSFEGVLAANKNTNKMKSILKKSRNIDADNLIELSKINAGDDALIADVADNAKEAAEYFNEKRIKKLSDTPLNEFDTVGRKLNGELQQKLNETFLKNKKGQVISVYAMRAFGVGGFRNSQIGLVAGTLKSIEQTIAQYKPTSALKHNFNIYELYINMKNPLVLNYTPFELSIVGLHDLVEREIMFHSDFMRITNYKKASLPPSYKGIATKNTRELIKKAGYDGIIYFNDTTDKGSMSVVAFDEEQIVYVANNGILQNDNVSENYFDLQAIENSTSKIDNTSYIRQLIMKKLYNESINLRADERIKIGESGFMMPSKTTAGKAEKILKKTIDSNLKVELSGRDTKDRNVGNKITKDFNNTVFKDETGDLLSLYIHLTPDYKIERAIEEGVTFETFDSVVNKWIDRKKKHYSMYLGNFNEVYINSVNPFVLRLNQWDNKKVAKILLKKGIITENFYNNLASKKTFKKSGIDNYVAKLLLDRIKLLGCDSIIYVNTLGEYSVMVFDKKQIAVVSKNGILVKGNDISNPDGEDEVIDNIREYKDVIIDAEKRTVLNIDNLAEVISMGLDNTQKMKIFTEFFTYKGKKSFSDLINRKAGNSGLLEKTGVDKLQSRAMIINLIKRGTLEKTIADTDIVGRKLSKHKKSLLKPSIMKNNLGQPLSIFTSDTYDKYQLYQIGIYTSTLTAANDIATEFKALYPRSKVSKFREYYPIVEKPYHIMFDPENATPAMLAKYACDDGVFTQSQYKTIMKYKKADDPKTNVWATQKIIDYLKQKGYDSITFMNERMDAGSIGLIVFDKSQLIPVAVDGLDIEDNDITLADSDNEPAFLMPENEDENFVEKGEKVFVEDFVDVEYNKKKKKYLKRRPTYGKNQLIEVWNLAKKLGGGKVFDPTGKEIIWDTSKARNGQWDMGHIPGQKYSMMHKKYLNDEITEEEFVAWYRDPRNYRPELPSTNRSHKYE